MTEEFIKLRSKDIEVGKPLKGSVYDSNGTFLVKQGFIIKSEDQLDRLIARGAFGKKAELAADEVDEPTVTPERIKDVSPFKLLENVGSELTLALTKTDNIAAEIMELVSDIQQACQRDAHAAIASLFVLEGSSYPIKHSVDVAVLCAILAKSRALPLAEQNSLIAASLTMNIAMIELQEELYRQESPLTAAQKEAIQQHPKQGVLILRNAGVSDALWLKAVLAHHETITGTGYPNGLTGSQYPKDIQLISLADQYCARLSPRAYRDPLLHKGILREILLDQGKTVEQDIAGLFIKELGFYPPGLLVQLANTEIGVVTKRGDRPDSPIVHACSKPQLGNYGAPKERNTALESFKIRKILASNDACVTFERRHVWRFNED